MLASAKTTPRSNNQDTGLVLPRSGAPLSLDLIEERWKNLENGTSDAEVINSRIYRDSAGRLRIESLIPRDSDHPAGATSFPCIDIIDPVAASRILVLCHLRVAHRMPFPRSDEGTPPFLGIGFKASLASSHRLTAKTEDCGKRTIEGFEFDGTRIIQTAEDQPPLTIAIEQWYSKDLKLIGAMTALSADETYAARIENLRREEPDPSLFRMPQGLRSVVDMGHLPDEP